MSAREITIVSDNVLREARAIDTIGHALDRLSPEERHRVMVWATMYVGQPGIATDLAHQAVVMHRPGAPLDINEKRCDVCSELVSELNENGACYDCEPFG